MNIHPSATMSFDHLYNGLMACVVDGTISRKVSSENGLELFNYNETCSFEHRWNEFNRLARGFIVDSVNKRVVATPFPKFFNAGEQEATSIRLDAEFEVYQKVDGSLGVVYFHNDQWHVATRGSFDSTQAQWATNYIRSNEKFLTHLDKDVTYCFEIVYPENQIVIRYGFSDLILLGAYHTASGRELDYQNDLVPLSKLLSCRIAECRAFSSFEEVLRVAKDLPGSEEGFVIRFKDTGERLKVKGDQYCILHKMISNITPLGIWDLMASGKNVLEAKKLVPEEFWNDFDAIFNLLTDQMMNIMFGVLELNKKTYNWSDKEVGLELKNLGPYASYLFPYRKRGQAAVEQKILKDIRPTGNVLPGYRSSIAMNSFNAGSNE